MAGDRATGHERIAYTFRNKELDYENSPHYQRTYIFPPTWPSQVSPRADALSLITCIRISVFFNKRHDVSYEHFYKHWATVHAGLTVSPKEFALFKIQRYTHHHHPPEIKAKIKQVSYKLLEFDGCTTMWARNWLDYDKFVTSLDFESIAGADGDCALFLDVDSITCFAGYVASCNQRL